MPLCSAVRPSLRPGRRGGGRGAVGTSDATASGGGPSKQGFAVEGGLERAAGQQRTAGQSGIRPPGHPLCPRAVAGRRRRAEGHAPGAEGVGGGGGHRLLRNERAPSEPPAKRRLQRESTGPDRAWPAQRCSRGGMRRGSQGPDQPPGPPPHPPHPLPPPHPSAPSRGVLRVTQGPNQPPAPSSPTPPPTPPPPRSRTGRGGRDVMFGRCL